MYKFDKSNVPLYIQLYEQMKERIRNGTKKSGEKLPSIRILANEYNLSKNTVQNAYNQLFAEGYIDSISQKGYYVSEDLYQDLIIDKPIVDTFDEKQEFRYDFYPAKLGIDSFPKKNWNRIYNKVLKEEIDYGSYSNTQGLEGLRIELKKYLRSSRAVNCNVDQIVICSGFSDAMIIVSMLFKEYTKSIAIEKDLYRVTKKVFEQMNYDIEYLNMNENGIILDDLKIIKSKLIYITPSHQYITGVTIPITNRIKLLNWAKKTKSFIIEDDYDSELSYYNQPIPALQGINNNDSVIYFGTLSKSFSPSLRVAYLVLPKCLVEKYKQTFDYSYSGVSIDIQKTLEQFLKEGYFSRHIRKIRTLNKKKHNLMKEFLEKKLGNEIQIIREGSGLNILIKPLINIDLIYLEQKCLEKNIKIYPRQKVYLSMGFGGFKENEIENAVEVFSQIWDICKKQEKFKRNKSVI